MNKRTKLIWKYFFQQKIKEIGIFLGIVIAVIPTPYYFFKFVVGKIFPEWYLKTLSPYTCAEIVQMWFSGFFVVLLMSSIGAFLIHWILNNWDKAKERARLEYKRNNNKIKR